MSTLRQPPVSFARDVVVNALGNVVAWPFLYVLGALTGLFPRNLRAIEIAIVIVVGGGGFLLMYVAVGVGGRRDGLYAGLGITLTGLAFLGTGIADVRIPGVVYEPGDWKGEVFWGVLATAAGIMLMFRSLRETRAVCGGR